MSVASLSPGWRKWRAERRLELIDAGMSPAEAGQFATQEAKGRSRIARTVGVQNAKAGRLEFHETNEGPTAFIIGGDIANVPPDERATAAAMSRAALMKLLAAGSA